MKKKIFLTLLMFGFFANFAKAATEPNWGPADTVACHMVGPGIKYTKIIYPKMPLILWYTVIDLTNPNNKIEQVQSRHAVPDPLRWDVMTHYKENSRPGHNVKVAWNHDFFSYEAGICIGNNISEGELTWTLWGRSLLAITKDKKAEVFQPNNIVCKAIAPDNTEVGIDYYNSSATWLNGDCILFNRMNSLTLTTEGKYIKIQPQATWTVNGADIPCKVLEISETPLQTSPTEYVLFLRNGKRSAFDGHLNVGDIVKISQKFNGAKWGTPPADILNAFHGYPSIAHDGVLHEGEYNDFENGREYEKSSHVMVGISKDKTQLHVLINEMSNQSKAVDCVELTNWMLNRDAWDVVNFDSGGSAAIVVNEEMLNLPGRGSIRPVQDAMLAVSLAPEDKNVDHLTFSKPYIYPSTISLTPLRVMAFNQYDEVLKDEVTGCTFTCEPATMGYVDANAIFHSSSKQLKGKIIAEKDGKRAEIIVNTRNSGVITPRLSNILIDKNRQYLLEIVGSTETEKFNLDPSAFSWVSSNPGVCVVEDGILKGISNGVSELTASFEDISFKINATVEIAKQNALIFDFMDLAPLKPSYSGVKNMTCNPAILPMGWADGATFKFDITSSRGPNFKFTPNKTLYSLPDSISFQIYDKEGIVKSINATYNDNFGGKYTTSFDVVADKDSTCVIRFAEKDGSIFEIGKYPIILKTIQFNLQNAKAGTGYNVALRNLIAYYPKGTGSVNGVEGDVNDTKLKIVVEAETVKLGFDAQQAGKAFVSMYSTTGSLIYKGVVDAQAGYNEVQINTKEATCGIYLLSVVMPQGMKSGKCIIR
ncbi:MAG: phosphodiester glycosidase family protein [Muribaculaceae bacterium]